MEILDRKTRKRNSGQGRTVSLSDKKIKINLDQSMINTLSRFAVSRHKGIKNSDLKMLRNFIELVDMSEFDGDMERTNKINHLKTALEYRVTNKIHNVDDVISIVNMTYNIDYLKEIRFQELDQGAIEFVKDSVTTSIKTGFIPEHGNKLIDLLNRFKAAPYRDRAAMVKEIETAVAQFHNEFRRTKMSEGVMTEFSLANGLLKNYVSDIYDIVTAPGRYLYTGAQGVNAILGGGFEATRVYLFAGNAGIGKSMFFLNILKQIKKWNKGYQAKNPTKIPTVLYLTQENTIEETVERLFAMITSGKKMVDFTKEEVQRILEEEGELVITEENNINIKVLWKPDRSIDTTDLYTIVEDMEDEGEECIFLLQDHIKRIRSYENCPDQRLELGKVMNELKVFAQMKQIPVATLAHLNRSASTVVENAIENNKQDYSKLLGRSNIGESLLMIDNADFAYSLNKEYDANGVAYLSLSLLKSRGTTSIKFIYQPYEKDNETNMLEDADGEPLFKDTLTDVNNAYSPTADKCRNSNMKVSMYNTMNSPRDLNEDDEEGIDKSLFSKSRKEIKTPPDGTLGNRVKLPPKVEIPELEVDRSGMSMIRFIEPVPVRKGPSVLQKKQNQPKLLMQMF